jgi:hypothetical protein
LTNQLSSYEPAPYPINYVTQFFYGPKPSVKVSLPSNNLMVPMLLMNCTSVGGTRIWEPSQCAFCLLKKLLSNQLKNARALRLANQLKTTDRPCVSIIIARDYVYLLGYHQYKKAIQLHNFFEKGQPHLLHQSMHILLYSESLTHYYNSLVTNGIHMNNPNKNS